MYYVTVQKKYEKSPTMKDESATAVARLCADWFLFSFNDKLKSAAHDDVFSRVRHGSGIVIYCKDEQEVICLVGKLRLADTSKSFTICHSAYHIKDAENEVTL
jgi:hypothetical protein